MNILVADTAPLIFLAKLTLLDVLCERISILVPSEVAHEATRRQELPDAMYIQKLIDDKRISIEHASSKGVAAFQKLWGLGSGESAALLLAESKQLTILTDDYPAMRVAKALRLSFVTTPLMIVEMNKQKLITFELARAKLDRLQEYAWLSPDVLVAAQILLKGGEI
jgi:predicted nucleic acid-binding protein